MARETIRRTARVCFDILLFALICFAEFAIQKWWTPFRRGFFCGDESLAYPVVPSTVSLMAMAIIILTVPTLVILAVELFKQLEPPCIAAGRRKPLTPPGAVAVGPNGASAVGSTGCRIGYRLLQCYKQIGYYLFGLGLTLIATEIPKATIGRLRPHFFALCQPLLADGSTCDDEFSHGHYITEYKCTNPNVTDAALAQVGQSFLSGHSSLLFYAMLYLAIYLQAMLSTRASKLLKHVLQFIFVVFAFYVSMTRVSDYHHHWSDVLAGAVMGTIIAIVVALFMADLFGRQRAARYIGTFKTQLSKTGNSSVSSTAKSTTATAALPAYTFGTLPYLHYSPQHHAQYSQATYQNYGYVQ